MSDHQSNPRTFHPSQLPDWVQRILGVAGILGVMGFMLMVLKKHWFQFSDFDQIYLAGFAWRRGIDPYTATQPLYIVMMRPTREISMVYFYTPLCSMLACPLSFLSFPVAGLLWRVGSFSLFLAATWHFMKRVLPDWPPSLRLFALGATAFSGSLRWNLVQWQPTALIVALLLCFACAVMDNRWKLCVLLGILISIKVTYLLPVIGLLLWREQWKWLTIMLGAILLLNMIALVPTGPTATLTAYSHSLRHMQDIRKQNYPDALDFLTPYLQDAPHSPLAPFCPLDRKPGEFSGEQIHVPFILSAWKLLLPWANHLYLPCAIGMVAAFIVLARRTMGMPIAQDALFQSLLFCGLMCLSLLLVYHQRYDAVALTPLLPVCLALLQCNPRHRPAWLLLFVTAVYAYLINSGMLSLWYSRIVVPYGLLPLTPVCGYMTMAAFLLTFVCLRRYVTEYEQR